jgi:hypothetical protein
LVEQGYGGSPFNTLDTSEQFKQRRKKTHRRPELIRGTALSAEFGHRHGSRIGGPQSIPQINIGAKKYAAGYY